MAHGILVALDGSAFAARAVPYAALLARRCQAELILARAIHGSTHLFPTAGASAPAALAQHRTEAEIDLAQQQRALGAETFPIKTQVVEGPAAPVLLEAARAQDVALIVMATHGRSGPSRWVMGSTAEQVLRETHLPILLLTPWALDAGPPDRLTRRVVVPLDGSDVGQRIVPIAGVLARRLRASVTFVRALEHPRTLDTLPLEMYGVPTPPDYFETAQAAAMTTLGDQAERWRAGGLDADFTVDEGLAADVIVAAAREREAGWIAMASHGRGGLGGLVLGSTALAVLHRSTLPVLIAAAPHFDAYRVGEAA